jgi:hypothetical protein
MVGRTPWLLLPGCRLLKAAAGGARCASNANAPWARLATHAPYSSVPGGAATTGWPLPLRWLAGLGVAAAVVQPNAEDFRLAFLIPMRLAYDMYVAAAIVAGAQAGQGGHTCRMSHGDGCFIGTAKQSLVPGGCSYLCMRRAAADAAPMRPACLCLDAISSPVLPWRCALWLGPPSDRAVCRGHHTLDASACAAHTAGQMHVRATPVWRMRARVRPTAPRFCPCGRRPLRAPKHVRGFRLQALVGAVGGGRGA